MATGSIGGVNAILRMFKEILGGGALAVDLAAVVAAEGVTFDETIAVPDPAGIQGFSTHSTVTPMTRGNAIQIYYDGSTVVERFVNIDGPIHEEVEMVVRWLILARIDEIGSKQAIAARAVQRALRRRWRAENTDAVLCNMTVSIDAQTNSLRLAGQTPSLGGLHTTSGDNIEPVIIRARCIQRVDAPVDLT